MVGGVSDAVVASASGWRIKVNPGRTADSPDIGNLPVVIWVRPHPSKALFRTRHSMQIQKKVVLITGASEGIGAACARAFRDRGAVLSLTARSEGKLLALAGPDDLVTAGDITDPQVRQHVVENTIQRFGRIDILINNAGAGLYRPAWAASEQEARALFELNLFAPLEMIRLAVPQMRARRSGMAGGGSPARCPHAAARAAR